MITLSPSEKNARQIVGCCTLAASGTALIAILVRGFGQWSLWLSNLQPCFPVAIYNACFLMLMAAALFVHSRWPQRRGSRIFGGTVVGVIGAASLVVLARLWFPINIEFEAWFVDLAGSAARNRRPHMSPQTAGTFLCAAGALGSLLVAGARARWRRPLACTLAFAAFGNGLIVLLGFAIGTPLIYYHKHPSMTWMTAGIFVVLAVSLMLAAYPNNWLLQGLAGESRDKADARSVRYRRALVVTLLLLNAGIAAAGLLFLRRQQFDLRARVEQELTVVADFKAARIADWRRERLKEASLLLHTPYAARRALDALAEPSSPSTREMFTAWLDPFLATGPYAEALLLDGQLNVSLVHPERGAGVLAEAERGPAEAALGKRQVVVTDLHRAAEDSNAIHLSLLVPLVVRREGTRDTVPAAGHAPSAEDRSAAVLVLRLDARQTLFPLVETWPMANRSAEMLLVGRDANDAIYLSELRYQANAALQLRLPLTRTNSPAVLAALGAFGADSVLRGLDYRNVPVLAATRKISNSPWSLLAKVDEEEIYAPVREQGRALGIILAALMAGVTLGLNLLWRQRDIEFLRRQMRTEHERFVLAERLAHLMKHANDIIVITDDQWRILEVNDRGLEQYGYTLPELQQMRATELQAAAARADFPAFDERFQTQGHVVAQTVHQRKDKSTFPVESSIRKVEIDGVTHGLAIIRDITERNRLEAEVLQVSEREQCRIAQDLHDGVGQQLGGIACLSDVLKKNLADQASGEAETAAKISRLLTVAMAQTRSLARGLHPVPPETNGLMSALEDLAACITDLFKVSCHFQCRPAVLIADNTFATHLYRIAQEAVTNAIKHGRARRIEIVLSSSPERITLAVSNDGVGYSCSEIPAKGLGLRIMNHRANVIGGTVVVRAKTGGGTEAICTVQRSNGKNPD